MPSQKGKSSPNHHCFYREFQHTGWTIQQKVEVLPQETHDGRPQSAPCDNFYSVRETTLGSYNSSRVDESRVGFFQRIQPKIVKINWDDGILILRHGSTDLWPPNPDFQHGGHGDLERVLKVDLRLAGSLLPRSFAPIFGLHRDLFTCMIQQVVQLLIFNLLGFMGWSYIIKTSVKWLMFFTFR